MVIPQEMQHTVRYQKGILPPWRMSIFLRLRIYLIHRNHNITETQFAALRVKIILSRVLYPRKIRWILIVYIGERQHICRAVNPPVLFVHRMNPLIVCQKHIHRHLVRTVLQIQRFHNHFACHFLRLKRKRFVCLTLHVKSHSIIFLLYIFFQCRHGNRMICMNENILMIK